LKKDSHLSGRQVSGVIPKGDSEKSLGKAEKK